ncbi:MAG TPA: cation-translocating P-type ATPase, partial [Bacteroidia bacterium]|nr:cation-translocating P-type ATPase [Bacteroidia bacterium]
DPHVVGRESVPDRQQQSGDDVELAGRELGDLVELLLPERGKAGVLPNLSVTDERSLYKMIHEYPLEGKPPMMTHIFEDTSGKRIIAAKGAIEALISVSDLTENERKEIDSAAKNLSADGYRLLGVAEAAYTGNQFPENQREFKFTFKGIVAFYDPPKENIRSVLQAFYKAGITVKIITGDNPQTTSAIAKQIGFKGYENSMSGDELLKLNEKELKEKISNYQLFTRMFPEAKLRIINAYKANGEIVAMTGDGVNDAPALKSAHIGIAMQKKGTEIAKQAASLILLEDDLSKMVDAIAMGRKIYGNLKKAIQYIVSIHLPIIFIVFIPVALGWKYTSLFSPIHIIFFELIMGPTCSIVYENEPIEQNAMLQKPRCFTTTFFNWKELTTSIVQGMIITIGALMVYQHAVAQEYTEAITRTMIFTFLISANIFLTMVNRSFYYSILTTLRYKNKLFVLIIIASILITAALLLIPPLTTFFEFESLVPFQLIISIAMGFLSVIWFESIKAYKRRNSII